MNTNLISLLLLIVDPSYKLFLQTNKFCNNINNSSVTSIYIPKFGGSIIAYYISHLQLFGSYSSSSNSTSISSERRTLIYSMVIGGITPSSDNNVFLMNILSTELLLLVGNNIQLRS